MINTHLTEDLLEVFLKERIDDSFERGRYIKDYKIRPDFISDKHMVVIEFDGYRHYNTSSVIIKDQLKDKMYRNMGYFVIRIPYFIQLDSRVIEYLFWEMTTDYSDFNTYPHGFIDSKALLPSDFCSLGINRFIDDLKQYTIVRNDILRSMDDKIEKLGDERLVVPSEELLEFFNISYRLGKLD